MKLVYNLTRIVSLLSVNSIWYLIFVLIILYVVIFIRIVDAVALIFGGGYLFSNLIMGCLAPIRRTSRSEAPAFLMAGIFQGLSLLLLNSAICTDNTLLKQLQSDVANIGNTGMDFPDSCSINTGANCAIAAIVFWLLAAMTSHMGVVAENKAEVDGVDTEPLIPGENL